MQATGMLRGTGAVVYLLLGTIILVFIGNNAHALPLQVLPNIPGYIPVYIRTGDQPLEDINPALAEAFHEKQNLENIQAERQEHIDKILENRPSYDDVEDDDGLDAGAQKKGTVYLIGVRQSSSDNDGNVPKIALPFELVDRERNAEEGQDRNKSEDAWFEEPNRNHGRKPIALSKEAVIKTGGLPVDVKDLERLAADVEKEETRPNDLYDSSSSTRGESLRRLLPSTRREKLAAANRLSKVSSTDEDDFHGDTRLGPVEDPKETRSSRRLPSEPMLRPARDPKESRPEDAATDFMEGEE